MKKLKIKKYNPRYIFCLVLLFLGSTQTCFSAPPSAENVGKTVTNLWFQEQFDELENYIVTLYNSNPRYVPAIMAKAFYVQTYNANLNAAKELMFLIVCDMEKDADEYNREFKFFFNFDYSNLKDMLLGYQEAGVTPESSAQSCKDILGDKLDFKLVCLLVVPDRVIPTPTTLNDDDQAIPVGEGQPNTICIDSGANGVCETFAQGDDIQIRPCVDVPLKPAIYTGPDGICNTVVRGDDTQIILTNCGNSGATCVTAGSNLIRETHEKGDDVVDGTSILVGDNGVCESDANH